MGLLDHYLPPFFQFQSNIKTGLLFGGQANEALRLAGEIRQSLAGLQVKVTVLDEVTADNLPDIPATPAYFLNGRLLFLGNPRWEELVDKIASPGGDKGGEHE